MYKIDINCDVGEGLGNEREIMPFIQSCNIACGGHAGNESLMEEVVALAIKNNVKIGAHPSYPDVENFGRRSIKLSKNAFTDTILDQINTLRRIIADGGARMNHIKAHGALYNDLVVNEELTNDYLNILAVYKENIKFFVPYGSVIAEVAIKNGFTIVYEAFADRNYNDDLSLVSRKEKNAMISDPKIMLEHILEIKNLGTIRTIRGKHIPIKANTFCLHSDTENIIESIKYLDQNLNKKL